MQLDFWYRLGWRDCANVACAIEWGPMPQVEFRADPTGRLCTVCVMESGVSEAKVQDRVRYTGERREAVRRRAREQNARLTTSDKRRRREARREYHRQRYLARKGAA